MGSAQAQLRTQVVQRPIQKAWSFDSQRGNESSNSHPLRNALKPDTANKKTEPLPQILGVRIGENPVPLAFHHRLLHTHHGSDIISHRVDAAVSQKRVGYGLQELAWLLGESESVLPTFQDLYGDSPDSGRKAHDCVRKSQDCVKYVAHDAELIFKVFQNLKDKLSKEAWCSQVHRTSSHKVLQNKLLAKKPGSSLQWSTGKSMWDFYELYMRDFLECIADLEQTGVGLNIQKLKEIEQQMAHEKLSYENSLQHHLNSIKDRHGEPMLPDLDRINFGSNVHLQHLLFGLSRSTRIIENNKLVLGSKQCNTRETPSLNLPPPKKQSLITECGMPRVSAAALSELLRGPLKLASLKNALPGEVDKVRESIKLIIEFRNASNINSRVKPLLIRGASGRVHASWKFDTTTGRLACRNPNLQNIPLSHKIRDAFHAAPGNMLVVADYAHFELRVLAHMAKCPNMKKKFLTGGDYHSMMAAQLFPHVQDAMSKGKVSMDEGATTGTSSFKSIFSRERASAKAVNFGILYGESASSLAEKMDMTLSQAQDLIEAWFKALPAVKIWMRKVKKDAHQEKRVLSLLGRWRDCPLLENGVPIPLQAQSERAAINFVIQGSAADIMLGAMLQLWRHTRLEEMGFSLVLQVHDELVLEGPQEFAEEAGHILRDIMCNPFRVLPPQFEFRVPLYVKVGLGNSWGSVKTLHQ